MKCYEVLRFGEVVALCIGFVPTGYFMKRENLRVGRFYEVTSDCGGSHQVVAIFNKDEKGNNLETISLVDDKYTDVSNHLTVLGKDNDWCEIFRSLEKFEDTYGEAD